MAKRKMEKHHYFFIGGASLGTVVTAIVALTTSLTHIAAECGKLLDALTP